MVQLSTKKGTQKPQLERLVEDAKRQGKPFRMRVRLTAFDYGQANTTVDIREASWNLYIQPESLTVEGVEEVIRTLGVAIGALVELGAEATIERLTEAEEGGEQG